MYTTGSLTSTGSVTLKGLTGANYIQCGCFGTYSGAQVVCEGSQDGTNFFPISMVRMDNHNPESGIVSLNTNESRGWVTKAPSNWVSFRIRCTAISSGTLQIGIDAISDQNQPVVTATTQVQEQLHAVGGKFNYNMAAGAGGAGLVCNTPCRLCRIVVNAVGTAATIFYDNTAGSGNIVYTLKASPAVGDIYDVQMPCNTALYAGGATNTSGCTLSFIPF